MCHISRNSNSGLEVTARKSITTSGVFPMPSSNSDRLIAGLEQRQQSKMTFRLSPFRKVAKSARINLNRYWGILSQSSAMKSTLESTTTTTSSSSPKSKCRTPSMSSSEYIDYSEEVEQNRINEMLEAQAEAAMIENDRNSEYENSPDFHQIRRICYQSSRRPMSLDSSTTSSPLASSSSLFIPCPSEDEYLDVISQDSVFL